MSRAGSVEMHDGAQALTVSKAAVALVDVVECGAPRDHLVEFQPALPVELEVLRDVYFESRRAERRTLQPSLTERKPRVFRSLHQEGSFRGPWPCLRT